jgi:hypothetical protein
MDERIVFNPPAEREGNMDDRIERGATGGKVSRRWLLRSTANLTAGLVAAGTVNAGAAETNAAETAVAPDHDPVTGEIFDRDRHHHWDTV